MLPVEHAARGRHARRSACQKLTALAKVSCEIVRYISNLQVLAALAAALLLSAASVSFAAVGSVDERTFVAVWLVRLCITCVAVAAVERLGSGV